MSAWKNLRVHRREDDLAGGRSTSPRVDRLLDSARAPGTSRELAREDDAAMLFHRAHLERVHTTREETSMPKPSPRAGLKAAIASAGVVALMSTGAAFATSGHTPWSGVAAARPTVIPSHSHPTNDPSETATDDPSESADTSAPESDGTTGPDAHAYPGLCRAYAAGQKSEHGAALSSPAFAALVAAAGGTDAVTGFCASLVPGHPTHPAHPTHPVSPTHPVTPTHPVPPTHPVTPTHPTPTHAAPTHPTHPTHPSHPAGTSHPGSAGTHPSRP
jgi:hypothetical protein